MEKKCEGCGTILQTTDNQAPGYVPDLSMDYCQRCFRMIHYDKHTETNVEPLVTLKALENVEGDFFWIIDVMDLETSLNSAFIDFYHNRECTIILNKCDLLPEAMTEEKLLNYICERIDELKINCNKIIIRGMGRHFLEDFAFIADTGNRMIFTGVANAGKSTVINHLLKENRLTANRHPSTTLNFNEVETPYGTVVDTVGLVLNNSVQAYLDSNDLKKVVPSKAVNPTVYQLNGNQTISIGGLCRMDFYNCEDFTAVLYLSSECPLHRTKTSNATALWKNHFGKELTPTLIGSNGFTEMKKTTFRKKEYKQDICIAGLGWVCLSGKFDRAVVFTDSQIAVYSRKAMI